MRIVVIAAALGLMAGCASPFDDMINNRYLNYPAQAVPAGMDGNWTGVMGPYLMTLQMREDGSGVFCNSYGASNYMQAVKYNAGTIYVQDGTRLGVSVSADTLTATSSYSGAKPSVFQRDDDLVKAAPYCRENL